MVKVLLVDDEPDVELLAKQKFRKEISNGNFDLLFALNGQEALNVIEKEPEIAVVISDVNMPEMDGLTLLDKLHELSPSTKTIVVSAYGDAKTLRSAMNKGAFDFVTKPVDFNELNKSIELAISHYQPSSSLLHSYQMFLSSTFPKYLDLLSPKDEKTVLWDAFSLEGEMIVMGISAVSLPLPSEIAIAATHGILKSALKQNPTSSLTTLKKKLPEVIPSLEAQIFVGHYNLPSSIFSYATHGEFMAYEAGETPVPFASSEEVWLGKGGIILEHPFSSSRLILTPIS